MVINSIGYETGHHCSEDDLIVSIYKTLGEVFPNVYVKSTGTGLTNIVFYASDSALELDNEFISINVTPNENTLIITDDYNPIEMFSIKAAEEFRNQAIGWFGNGIL